MAVTVTSNLNGTKAILGYITVNLTMEFIVKLVLYLLPVMSDDRILANLSVIHFIHGLSSHLHSASMKNSNNHQESMAKMVAFRQSCLDVTKSIACMLNKEREQQLAQNKAVLKSLFVFAFVQSKVYPLEGTEMTPLLLNLITKAILLSWSSLGLSLMKFCEHILRKHLEMLCTPPRQFKTK